jgi:hypothetical protein
MFQILKIAFGVYLGKVLFKNSKKILVLCLLLSSQAKEATSNPKAYFQKVKAKSFQVGKYTHKTVCHHWRQSPNALPIRPQTFCGGK